MHKWCLLLYKTLEKQLPPVRVKKFDINLTWYLKQLLMSWVENVLWHAFLVVHILACCAILRKLLYIKRDLLRSLSYFISLSNLSSSAQISLRIDLVNSTCATYGRSLIFSIIF